MRPSIASPGRVRRLSVRRRSAIRALVASDRARGRLGLRLIAYSGAFATAYQIWLFLGGEEIAGMWLFLGFIGGLIAAGWSGLPSSELHLMHRSFNAEVNLVVGDLLAISDLPIAVTVNRHVDCFPDVSPGSLIAQLAIHEQHPADSLESDIRSAVGGSDLPLPLGTIVEVPRRGSESALLVAITSRHETNGSAVVVDEIWRSLTSLWDNVRARNAGGVACPVIGSGYARAQIGFVPLLLLQLSSYITSSMEMPIGALTIIVLPQDGTADVFQLVEDFCVELGFRHR